MTDNRTTELREKLTERGIKYRTTEVHGMPVTLYENGGHTWSVTDHPDGYMIVNCGGLTPEQAIAATLGSDRHPYEQRITGDGSDWGEIMRDAYDDLMASACESCTPEQMEQLADYIRAELGSGTCEVNGTNFWEWEWSDYTAYYEHELSCGHVVTTMEPEPPNFCEECGARIRKAVER